MYNLLPTLLPAILFVRALYLISVRARRQAVVGVGAAVMVCVFSTFWLATSLSAISNDALLAASVHANIQQGPYFFVALLLMLDGPTLLSAFASKFNRKAETQRDTLA